MHHSVVSDAAQARAPGEASFIEMAASLGELVLEQARAVEKQARRQPANDAELTDIESRRERVGNLAQLFRLIERLAPFEPEVRAIAPRETQPPIFLKTGSPSLPLVRAGETVLMRGEVIDALLELGCIWIAFGDHPSGRLQFAAVPYHAIIGSNPGSAKGTEVAVCK